MLPNSIIPEKYHFNENSRKELRKELGIDERELVLGNVGRLVPQKNQQFLIDLLPSLLKKLPNLLLALVGSGRLRKELEHKALDLGVDSHVRFLGVRTDVDKLYSVFDVFVFPSLFEGLPEALIEAQANGLACLVSTEVPRAARVTDKCSYLELVPETWIDSILELKPEYSRESGYRQILESSYNLKKSKTMFSDALLRGTEQAELLPDNDN
jgi:glycosyltransferase involved in cell wall biosynthesis